MSVAVPKSGISRETSELIHKLLTITPEESYVQKQLGGSSPEPITCYYTDEDYVYLPYFLTRVLLKQQKISCQDPLSKTYGRLGFNFTGTLYENQQEVVEEAWGQLQEHGTTSLNLCTGYGKTVIAAYLAALTGLPTLVLYNIKKVQSQWAKTFKEFTTASVWVQGYKGPEVPEVTVSTVGCLHHLPDDTLRHTGCLILDETHRLCTRQAVKAILQVHPKYVISCTATPERADQLHKISSTICGEHSVVRELAQEFIVYYLDTGIQVEPKKNARGFVDWASLNQQLTDHEERNQLIAKLVTMNPQRKILILTRTVKHVDTLRDLIGSESVDTLYSNKNSYHDSNVLLGTISKIGTGFDEEGACKNFQGTRINMLILACSVKSRELLEQAVGRIMRSSNPVIVDLVDRCKTIKNHWRERRKWYIGKNSRIISMGEPQSVD